MTICYQGLEAKTEASAIVVSIQKNHPLIKLAQKIPWTKLAEIVIPDLQKTEKGFCDTGRRLYLRNHLGALLLQKMFGKKDRNTEWEISDNAAYMLFCGCNVLEKWSPLDHTTISKFRNRLTPETHRKISNFMAKLGVDLGYGDPSELDQDSTIQEANASYPSDASLMVKAAEKIVKIIKWLKEKSKEFQEEVKEIDLKKIKKKAREYFFSKKGKDTKQLVFKGLYDLVNANLSASVGQLKKLNKKAVNEMPWNIKADYNQIKNGFSKYMKSVLSFIDTGKIDPKKILSWHLADISCFNKGKAGNKLEFGRCFQLGRIGGNFALVGKCTDVRMEDKKSISSVTSVSAVIFGPDATESFGADKGYYSKANLKYIQGLKGIKEHALQQPGISFKGCLFKEEEETYQRLVDRRSSIEGMIGHIKQGGQLGKSRMKSDQGTLSAGYGAVTGYNLRCLMRHIKKES